MEADKEWNYLSLPGNKNGFMFALSARILFAPNARSYIYVILRTNMCDCVSVLQSAYAMTDYSNVHDASKIVNQIIYTTLSQK